MRKVFLFIGLVMVALNGCKMQNNSSLTKANDQTTTTQPKITTTVTREGRPVACEKVYIDDQERGTTSDNGQVEAIVEAGTHTVRAGEFSKQIHVQKDGQAWHEIQLPPLIRGNATLTTKVTRQGEPVACEKVYIDDTLVGVTYQNGQVQASVMAGTHKVKAGAYLKEIAVQEGG